MKNWRINLTGLFLVADVICAAGADRGWAQGMMEGRCGMMRGEGMRQMMQNMIGDMLPPPMDPDHLPNPNSHGARLLQKLTANPIEIPKLTL